MGEPTTNRGRAPDRTVDEALRGQPWRESGTLDLARRRLSGLPERSPVPDDDLRRLHHLDLRGNRLGDLPAWLWGCPSLETLLLSGNRLRLLDPMVGGLGRLRTLDVADNRLTEVPTTLGSCRVLGHLNLGGNLLKDVDALGGMEGLVSLNLSGNRLESLDGLPGHHTLRRLDVSYNRIRTLPGSLRRFRRLIRLDLAGNQLTDDALAALLPLDLEELYLDGNHLTSPVDPGRWPRLRRLSIFDNPCVAPIFVPRPAGGPAAPPDVLGRGADPAGGGPPSPDPVEVDVITTTLRGRIVGGADPGRHYFEGPTYQTTAGLMLTEPADVATLIDLYYRGFRHLDPTVEFADRSSISLAALPRSTALAQARLLQSPDAPAIVTLPPSRDPGVVSAGAAFFAQAATRLTRTDFRDQRDRKVVTVDQPPLADLPRVMNVAVDDTDGTPVRDALEPARDYRLRVNIAARTTDTVVTNPTPVSTTSMVAHQPDGYWIDLIVSSADLLVAPGPHRLFLPTGGPSWVCDCTDRHHCTPATRAPLLTVPFRTTTSIGAASLRCTTYHDNSVVQSVRIDLTVGGSGGKPPSATVDFALVNDAAQVPRLDRRDLSLVVSRTPSGTHTLVVKGSDHEISLTLTDARVTTATQAVRSAALRAMLGGDGRTNQYDQHNQKPVDRFVQDLTELALYGTQLYGAVVPDRPSRRRLRESLGSPSTIQVSRLVDTVFPWAFVYDLHWDLQATRILCPLLADWDRHRHLLADYPAGCPFQSSHDDNVLCPYGFWGFRHLIEQPPSVRTGTLRTQLTEGTTPSVVAARALTLDHSLTAAHFTRLHDTMSARFTLDTYESRTDIRTAFGRSELPLIYLYCHGYRRTPLGSGDLTAPVLQIGADQLIGVTDLQGWGDRWDADHWRDVAPLAFINGCETAAFDPGDLLSFVEAFAGLEAAGVVGTETPVCQPVASEFAERFYRSLTGSPPRSVGTSLHQARIDLLAKGNVSGLVYTPFCSMDLTMPDT